MELIDGSMADVLADRALATPDRPALRDSTAALAYAELDHLVDDAAGGLVRHGVQVGDAVGVLMGSSLAHAVAVYAIWRAGAAWVPLNPQLTDDDIRHCLVTANAALVLCEDAARSSISGSSDPLVRAMPTMTLESLPSGHAALPAVPSSADAVIAFTSGTTGRSKGVVHSHQALRFQTAAVVEHYNATPDDRWINLLPMYLMSIFLSGPALAIEAGGSCSIMERYDVDALIDLIARDRPTIMAAVPVLFSDINSLPPERRSEVDLSSLRIVSCGGAPLSNELRETFERRFDFRIIQAYGGTEAPGIVATDPITGERRPGSVGRALPHLRMSAVDADWNELPPGEHGDLCSQPIEQGPLAGRYEPMREYRGMPKQTAAVRRGSRLRWNDVGYVDADGFVFLLDRRQDVIIRGGMNVYPRRLEQVISSIPGVLECAVVGLPDARLGEVPHAFVRLGADERTGADDIKRYVNERLASYERIESVQVVDEFPRNALGKILKRELRS